MYRIWSRYYIEIGYASSNEFLCSSTNPNKPSPLTHTKPSREPLPNTQTHTNQPAKPSASPAAPPSRPNLHHNPVPINLTRNGLHCMHCSSPVTTTPLPCPRLPSRIHTSYVARCSPLQTRTHRSNKPTQPAQGEDAKTFIVQATYSICRPDNCAVFFSATSRID